MYDQLLMATDLRECPWLPNVTSCHPAVSSTSCHSDLFISCQLRLTLTRTWVLACNFYQLPFRCLQFLLPSKKQYFHLNNCFKGHLEPCYYLPVHCKFELIPIFSVLLPPRAYHHAIWVIHCMHLSDFKESVQLTPKHQNRLQPQTPAHMNSSVPSPALPARLPGNKVHLDVAALSGPCSLRIKLHRGVRGWQSTAVKCPLFISQSKDRRSQRGQGGRGGGDLMGLKGSLSGHSQDRQAQHFLLLN